MTNLQKYLLAERVVRKGGVCSTRCCDACFIRERVVRERCYVGEARVIAEQYVKEHSMEIMIISLGILNE